ncbi:hypothetical protein RIF29_24917 [Crotalaria pallida]|uniref:Uncharacterized protein n=1 Tax=Crotalaria pallida TaxID=3830 RepID=A0AAN9HX12_CROPI
MGLLVLTRNREKYGYVEVLAKEKAANLPKAKAEQTFVVVNPHVRQSSCARERGIGFVTPLSSKHKGHCGHKGHFKKVKKLKVAIKKELLEQRVASKEASSQLKNMDAKLSQMKDQVTLLKQKIIDIEVIIGDLKKEKFGWNKENDKADNYLNNFDEVVTKTFDNTLAHFEILNPKLMLNSRGVETGHIVHEGRIMLFDEVREMFLLNFEKESHGSLMVDDVSH